MSYSRVYAISYLNALGAGCWNRTNHLSVYAPNIVPFQERVLSAVCVFQRYDRSWATLTLTRHFKDLPVPECMNLICDCSFLDECLYPIRLFPNVWLGKWDLNPHIACKIHLLGTGWWG